MARPITPPALVTASAVPAPLPPSAARRASPKVDTPWTIDKRPGSRFYRVRISHANYPGRIEQSTGETEEGPANVFAAALYAQVVAGAYKPAVKLVVTCESPLEELCAEWLADIKYPADNPWWVYARHWHRYFGTLRALVAEDAISGYWLHRLKTVKRTTVMKETGGFQSLIEWTHRHGYVSALVEVPKLPTGKNKQNQGVPYHIRRRGEATEITDEHARAIIDALPIWSTRGRGGHKYPVRPFFEIAYELGLRPNSTLAKLSVPRHYTKGSAVLKITADIDKANFEREIDLTPEARYWLDLVCPPKGLIFGKHNHRNALDKAVEAAGLPPHLAETMTTYDFKHRAAVEMARGGDLPGMMHVMGWKLVTTANNYVRKDQKAGAEVLAARRRKRLEDAAARAAGRDPNAIDWGSEPVAPAAAVVEGELVEVAQAPAAPALAPATDLQALPAGSAADPVAAHLAAADSALGPAEPATPVAALPAVPVEGEPSEVAAEATDAVSAELAAAAATEPETAPDSTPPIAPELAGAEAWVSGGVGASPGQPGEGENPNDSAVRRRGLEPPRPIRALEPESQKGEIPQSFRDPQRPLEALKHPSRPLRWGTDPSSLYHTRDTVQGPSGDTPPPPSDTATDVASMAGRVLLTATRGEQLPVELAQELARAALSATEVGRLALAVLDGGPAAGSAAVHLALLLGGVAAASQGMAGGAR